MKTKPSAERQVNSRQTIRALMMMAALAAAIAPGGDRALFGQCAYSVQQIVPGPCDFGGPPALIARGLNNLGHVVGDFADCFTTGVRHPFLWIDGEMTVFPIPEWALRTHFMDINDLGLIAGHHILPDGLHGVGFVLDWQKNEWLEFGPKHGIGGSWANAINNAGIVAGTRTIAQKGDPWPWPRNAVIWDTNTGEITDLGVLNGPNSAARAINDQGNVGGWTGLSLPPGQSAFLRIGEKIIIGLMPNGTSTDVRGMNDHNTAAGGGSVTIPGSGTVPRGFVWDGKEFILIEPLPGFSGSSANAINNVRQIAGASTNFGGQPRALLWQHGLTIDLNDLVSGPVLEVAPDINENGQILARTGTRGALLTPLEVPVGDLNLDCRVDYHDLIIMFEQWGPVPRKPEARAGAPGADLNGDGVVNVTDLLILFDNWTN